MKSNFEIRLIEETDSQAVLDIYKYYVAHTVISFEFEAPTLEEYTQRIKANTEKYPWLLVLCDNKIIGFAYGSTHRSRTAYQWSPESTIYIMPGFHTQGIGRVLYETLFAILKLQGYYNVFAGVAIPNEKSAGFHKALGFETIGIFRNVGYKHGNWHDTQWFQRVLNKHKMNPAAPKKLKEVIKTVEFSEILKRANKFYLKS